MKSATNALAAVFLAAGFSAQAQAAIVTVTDWNLTGQPGDQVFTAPSSAALHVTGANLVRGGGLTGNTGANSINATGWNNQANDYFSFGFSLDSGYQVDLSKLFIGTRSSATGPGTLGLYYSADSFAAPIVTFNQAPGANFVNSAVDLSALPNLTGSLEFRILQIGNTAANGGTTSAAGTFRITDYFETVEASNFAFTGEVSAVPVPAALPLMFSGLGVLSAFLRRRRAQV